MSGGLAFAGFEGTGSLWDLLVVVCVLNTLSSAFHLTGHGSDIGGIRMALFSL